jgi:uncharacterized membrane protein
MADLIAVSYPEEGTAEQVLDTLNRLGREYLIDLADACYVTRGQDGKVKLHQAVSLTAAGATTGALWGGLVGLLFLMPLAGLLVGGATGAVMGKLTDVGIDDAMMKRLGAELQPGSSALFVLVRSATTDKVLPEVQKYGGTVLQTSLSKEQEARLRAVLAEGHAAAAASDDAPAQPETAPPAAPPAAAQA